MVLQGDPCLLYLGVGQRPCLLKDQNGADVSHFCFEGRKGACDSDQQGWVAGEKTQGIKRGGEGLDAGHRPAAPSGTKTENAAVGRGDSHGAGGIGTECEIDFPSGHCRGGATRRAAGNALRRARVEGSAIEMIFSNKAEGEFIGNCLTEAASARAEEHLHGDRMRRGGKMRSRPCWISAARYHPG